MNKTTTMEKTHTHKSRHDEEPSSNEEYHMVKQ